MFYFCAGAGHAAGCNGLSVKNRVGDSNRFAVVCERNYTFTDAYQYTNSIADTGKHNHTVPTPVTNPSTDMTPSSTHASVPAEGTAQSNALLNIDTRLLGTL